MKLVTEESKLRKVCSPVKLQAGLVLGRKMLDFLLKYNREHTSKRGIGLAAPQVGEYKRVCVLLLDGKQIILVNPVITEHSDYKVRYNEGCLSLPGKNIDTYRWLWVKVQADNHRETLSFNLAQHETLLAIVAVQHEIDHLDGILITDRTIDDGLPYLSST